MSAESLARRVADDLAAAGFPRLPAQVLMALMVRPTGTMTAAELAVALRISAAAVSGAVRYLQLLGFLSVGTVPGTRRHTYSLPALPWYAGTLTQDRYSGLVALLTEGLGELEEGPARERLEEMTDFFRFIQTEMPLLWERWRDGRE